MAGSKRPHPAGMAADALSVSPELGPAPFQFANRRPSDAGPPSEGGMNSLLSFLQTLPQYHEYRFELVIVQQPIRARMCGFGDKDRRPCTPPPILKLLAFDRNNQPVDTESIDKSFLVVHVDLWSADRQTQQNLVLHPSLGQNLTASGDESPGASGSGPMYSVMSNDMSQSSPLSSPSNPRPQPISPPSTGLVASARNSSKMMEIRNLIGSPATSACKLYDTDGKLGIFFIFQDLSIRTEGTFTLKFSFVDIGTSQHQLNSGKDCVRFQVFSDPFTVYSAKKFPGMIESTPLSKCFVKQGIKISVRKESGGRSSRHDTDMMHEN